MSEPVTIQDIYDLFRTSQQVAEQRSAAIDHQLATFAAEATQRSAALDHQLATFAAEAEQRSADLDRQLADFAAEAKQRSADLDRQLADFAAKADQRAAEADRRAAEADRRLARIERIAAQANQESARLGERWGQFVENLVEPAVITLFQARGIGVQETYRRMKSKRPAAPMEIDIFAIDGDVAVAIEVKSRLARRDVEYFLEKLGRFKQSFIHFQEYQLYGAVAGIEIDENMDRYAYQQGLFVIRQCGDAMEIANDATFQPATW
ncbi:MAG: hypothetical protein ACHWZW_11185 [Spirulina sp.]